MLFRSNLFVLFIEEPIYHLHISFKLLIISFKKLMYPNTSLTQVLNDTILCSFCSVIQDNLFKLMTILQFYRCYKSELFCQIFRVLCSKTHVGKVEIDVFIALCCFQSKNFHDITSKMFTVTIINVRC